MLLLGLILGALIGGAFAWFVRGCFDDARLHDERENGETS